MNRLFLVLILLLAFCFGSCGKKDAPTANPSQPVSQEQSFVISTIANNGTLASMGGFGSDFFSPSSITLDRSGNVYIGDRACVRKITPASIVTTVAGRSTTGFADGPKASALFSLSIKGIAVDKTGNVYVSDTEIYRVRKITPDGMVSTLAGNGTTRRKDGTGANAQFTYPQGISIDADDNLYIVDAGVIRKITPDGTVTTPKITLPSNLTNAGLFIYALTIGADGNMYVIAGQSAAAVYKISPSGTTTFLAGQQKTGYLDGASKDALFAYMTSIVTDNSGNIYVYDGGNYRIRKITPSGTVTTFAGTGKEGVKDGPALNAELTESGYLACDNDGNIYLAHGNADSIRKISKQ